MYLHDEIIIVIRGRTGMHFLKIIWQGHPDISKLKRMLNLFNQSMNQFRYPCHNSALKYCTLICEIKETHCKYILQLSDFEKKCFNKRHQRHKEI